MKISIVCSAYAVATCLCGVLLPDIAEAKTVALWPIEWNDNTQWIDARCRIDPANGHRGDRPLDTEGTDTHTEGTDPWGGATPLA